MLQNRFQWDVFEGGYRWVDAPDAEGKARRWLITRVSPSTKHRVRVTFPLEDPLLSRKFAQLKGSEIPIAAFAWEHGSLTSGKIPLNPGPRARVPAELFEFWRGQILRMRDVLELLDSTDDDDLTTLRKKITILKDCARYSGWKVGITIDDPHYLKAPGLVPAARFAAQKLLNWGLAENTAIRVLYDVETGEFRSEPWPLNLLGAIWLQAAWTAAGKYRRCGHCETPFLLPEGRTDKRYCGERCRNRARKERDRAR